MISCKSCGKQLPDDAKFCLECGTSTSAPSSAPTVECSNCGAVFPFPKELFQIMGNRSRGSMPGRPFQPGGYQNRMMGGMGRPFMKQGMPPGDRRRVLTCPECGEEFAAPIPRQ